MGMFRERPCGIPSEATSHVYCLTKSPYYGDTFLLPLDLTDIPKQLRGTLRFYPNVEYANGVLPEQVDAIYSSAMFMLLEMGSSFASAPDAQACDC
jgi:hypothetical protein